MGGIAGLEEYEAPQEYLDASIAYKFSKYAEVFLDGTNLTNEYQRFYLVWPGQFGHSNFSERSSRSASAGSGERGSELT